MNPVINERAPLSTQHNGALEALSSWIGWWPTGEQVLALPPRIEGQRRRRDFCRWLKYAPLMFSQSKVLTFAIAAALALAACGGESEDSATSSDSTAAEGTPDTTAETVAESTDDEPIAEANVVSGGDGCDQVLTPEEYESIFGTSVEVTGSGQTCQLIFASDAVGTLQAFSSSKAEDATDALLTQSKVDEAVSAGGVLLENARGYVVKNSAIVVGDSGTVFRLDTPENVDVADIQATMQQVAALLVTR